MPKFDDEIIDTQMPADEFPLLEPGEYHAVVSSVEEKTAKESGKPLVLVTLRVLDKRYKNRLLWKYFQQNPEAEFAKQMVKLFVHALGFDPKEPDSYNTEKWADHELIVRVKTKKSSEFGDRSVPAWFLAINNGDQESGDTGFNPAELGAAPEEKSNKACEGKGAGAGAGAASGAGGNAEVPARRKRGREKKK